MNLKKCLASLALVVSFCISNNVYSKTSLESILKNQNLSNSDVISVKKIVDTNPKESIRKFLDILKDEDYPDRSRWLSLLLIGKTMGKKSVPMMIKYLGHPHWILRSAALKSLKSLKVTHPTSEIKKLLSDNSYVIREQALDMIQTLKIASLKNDVLQMLGDKTNYIKTKKGIVASEVIKKAIITLVALKSKESIPLLNKLKETDAGKNISPQISDAIKKISI